MTEALVTRRRQTTSYLGVGTGVQRLQGQQKPQL